MNRVNLVSARIVFVVAVLAVLPFSHALSADEPSRPNILWLTTEDISPDLGCYGVAYAKTPRLDRLAGEGVLYTNAFATSGVCAPARSCLISGVYPSSLGSEHMRCRGDLPDWFKFFPAYLREAGYYCTNNVKTDYNLPTPRGTWDESSTKAHFKNRKPGQPFFAVFNYMGTHESRMFGRHKTTHDPAKAPLPPYHPDDPLVREDWARYHDTITGMDAWAAGLLDELDAAGLADDTIVFFYGDHGAGLPRGKRWIFDSGLRVPLIVYFPENYRNLAPGKPGTRTDRLVSFVDFGPTVLSLAGVKVPDYMHGKPFVGKYETEPRQYVYGLRGRIDERYDMVRTVGDGRYRYVRNYFPYKTYALHQAYMYQMETMQVWDRLFREGKLNPIQSQFFAPRRPVEELYDTQSDPHEIHNLADSPEHQDILKRLRQVHLEWVKDTLDTGLLPEPELKARPRRDGFDNVWDWAREGKYPQDVILAAALRVGQGESARPQMIADLSSDDRAVRFWAVIGLHNLGESARPAVDDLMPLLEDEDPSVATEAAALLAELGHADKALPVLAKYLESKNQYVTLRAADAIDDLGPVALPLMPVVEEVRPNADGYTKRVLDWFVERQTASQSR